MITEKNVEKGLFQKASTTKKIGFISVILMVIGSSIGAGIFFKSARVLEYSGGNLIFAIISWIIAAVAVIALALALVEISSGRNDNLGMIGWNQTFASKHSYKMCKNLWSISICLLPISLCLFMQFYRFKMA